MLDRIRQEFVLGGHKAAAIATVLNQASVFLVSALPAGSIRCAGIRLFSTPDEALRAAVARTGESASVIAFPYAASSLPQAPA